jgi:ElaB/YqjD/DUF883 family membrane-anchored ribosome-binding protein
MSNEQRQNQETVTISQRDLNRIGRATGESVASELDDQLRSIKSNTSETTEEIRKTKEQISDLESKIEDLEAKIEEVERTKAEAKRKATASVKEKLEAQYEDKKEKFKQKQQSVLGDYQASIRRLKDRFVNAIPGQSEGFKQVNDEFREAEERRQTLLTKADELGTHGAGSVHEYRRKRMDESRTELTSAIDEFLQDRRETAETIDGLQTPIPSINGDHQLNIPFWVVGIERNGREEITVLPIPTRTTPDGQPTPRNPYVSYLKPHDTHDYSEWVSAVKEYVVRDEVRDKLARGGETFEDPSFLRKYQSVSDRFVDALEQFEMNDRSTAGATGTARRSSTGTESQRSTAAEVEMDD